MAIGIAGLLVGHPFDTGSCFRFFVPELGLELELLLTLGLYSKSTLPDPGNSSEIYFDIQRARNDF